MGSFPATPLDKRVLRSGMPGDALSPTRRCTRSRGVERLLRAHVAARVPPRRHGSRRPVVAIARPAGLRDLLCGAAASLFATVCFLIEEVREVGVTALAQQRDYFGGLAAETGGDRAERVG